MSEQEKAESEITRQHEMEMQELRRQMKAAEETLARNLEEKMELVKDVEGGAQAKREFKALQEFVEHIESQNIANFASLDGEICEITALVSGIPFVVVDS
jgi:5-formyltetrahydrofolate cyclo-ligase